MSAAASTLGKDVYVDSVTGSDDFDGLTPDRALATLGAAFAKCTDGKGDRINFNKSPLVEVRQECRG